MARSIGLEGNAADVLPALVARGVTPDVLTDQTSAHDALDGYVPNGLTFAEADAVARGGARRLHRRARCAPMADHVRAMLALQARGAVTFDYGNNIRAQAQQAGVANAFDIPGFVPEYVRPLFCEGKGPFRWAALSGDPEDIRVTDRLALEMFADDAALCRWIRLAGERVAFQGLPARIFWLGLRRPRALRPRVERRSCATGRVKAPIVIGRDHLDTGSVASPNRETEGMRDGSDAIADWPVLNALLNTASGATWVSVHHGGGVGIGYSLHAGMVVVADGTPEADERLERVLTNDPAIGVVRHADAGYPEAIATARRHASQHADARDADGAAPVIVERPPLERRVLQSLEASRIPVVLGGCGAGRTSLLLRVERLVGADREPVPRHGRCGDDTRAMSRGDSFGCRTSGVVSADERGRKRPPRSGARVPARRLRRADDVPRYGRDLRRPRDVPARRSRSTSARSRAFRASATCCAR